MSIKVGLIHQIIMIRGTDKIVFISTGELLNTVYCSEVTRYWLLSDNGRNMLGLC